LRELLYRNVVAVLEKSGRHYRW